MRFVMPDHLVFDKTTFEAFLDANQQKDRKEIAKYLHKDFVFIFNKHVFKRKSYLWFLKITYPLINFDMQISNLIMLENSITCKININARVLQDSHHLLYGKLIKKQYWKGCLLATYELKDAKILSLTLETQYLLPISATMQKAH